MQLGSLLIAAHQVEEAVEVLRGLTEELAEATGSTEDESADIAELGGEVWYWLGVAIRQRGDRRGALAVLVEGPGAAEGFARTRTRSRARIHFTIAELWHQDEKFEQAIAAYPESLTRIEQTGDPLAIAQVRRSLGLARCETATRRGSTDLAEAREERSGSASPCCSAELADVTARSLAAPEPVSGSGVSRPTGRRRVPGGGR